MTTAPGYPTVAALVPNLLATQALGATTGFLTKLTQSGNGLTFSTFIPGAGITPWRSIRLPAICCCPVRSRWDSSL